MMKLSFLIPLLALLPYGYAHSSQRFSVERRHEDAEAEGNSTKEHENAKWPQLKPKKTERACNYTFNELYKLQTKFLDAFIYPANQIQAKSINSSLFAPDVQGRVDITRTFTGRELNTEYIFGLFANLAAAAKNESAFFTLLGYATSYEIVHFAASQNIASASTRFNFTFPLFPSHPFHLPIIIDTWNVFDSHGQISMYDASFKYWQWTVDTLLNTAGKVLNKTEEQVMGFAGEKLIGSICATAGKFCKGENRQYNSTGECEKYLSGKVRLGAAYELGRNTLLCRMVHQNMVPYRPSVHCPHIGPSGGGYCDDDMDYAQVVTQGYFSNYPFAYSNRGPLQDGL